MNPLISTKAELELAYEASYAYLAVVRRVHAECGPSQLLHGWECPSCDIWRNRELLPDDHKPNCLWLAAEALLTKNVEGKP